MGLEPNVRGDAGAQLVARAPEVPGRARARIQAPPPPPALATSPLPLRWPAAAPGHPARARAAAPRGARAGIALELPSLTSPTEDNARRRPGLLTHRGPSLPQRPRRAKRRADRPARCLALAAPAKVAASRRPRKLRNTRRFPELCPPGRRAGSSAPPRPQAAPRPARAPSKRRPSGPERGLAARGRKIGGASSKPFGCLLGPLWKPPKGSRPPDGGRGEGALRQRRGRPPGRSPRSPRAVSGGPRGRGGASDKLETKWAPRATGPPGGPRWLRGRPRPAAGKQRGRKARGNPAAGRATRRATKRLCGRLRLPPPSRDEEQQSRPTR